MLDGADERNPVIARLLEELKTEGMKHHERVMKNSRDAFARIKKRVDAAQRLLEPLVERDGWDSIFGKILAVLLFDEWHK